MPHAPGRGFGRALHEAGYSENRLMRLTAARGDALVDQVLRAGRYLAQAGAVPINLRTVHDLIADEPARAEAARLRIARDYYTAEYSRSEEPK
jgi:CRISPR type I-E-associated protein CasB/Cse2